ncbi:CD226 antigen isoform X1 [Lynx rufus]|uniref:CD226 antigen isoform X1 n=1 Tax=Lynx rufus TaxID=61384 RepID=UPI001F126792|nr:CD226 antigen isoform X1 [Lynx rufus]XP_046942209.1 CD226 antigen isoform X1 [Lynx rufus]
MDYLAFFLAIVHIYRALCEEMFWDTTVKLAENMSLECVYSSLDTLTQMEWFKINSTDRESIAIFSPAYGVIIRTPYADRVYFLNSTMAPNDMTLTFHNVSEADVGYYSCLLHTFPYGHWEKVIRVVASGTTTHRLPESISPSPPEILAFLNHSQDSIRYFDDFEIAVPSDSHMVSEPGKNITLSCELPTKWPVQQITWEKIQPHQIDLLTSCNLSQGKIYTSKYQRWVSSDCSPGMTSTFITMPQAVVSDSGLYRCGFSAGMGENETFVRRLTVTDGKMDNQYTLFVAGGTVLSLLFVILMTAVIVISYRRRRRQNRGLFKEHRNKDAQNKATNNYRNPISTNQSSDCAREDIYVNYPAFSHRPKTRI